MFDFTSVASFEFDPAFWKKLKKGVKSGLTAQGKMIVSEAKRLMSKKVHKQLRKSKGEKAGRSRPGEVPRTDRGNYAVSIGYVIRGKVGFVGPRWPAGAHAHLLKYGTKKGLLPRAVPSEVALLNVRSRLTDLFRDKL